MADKGKGIADDYSSGKRKRDGEDKSRKRKNLNVLQFFEDSAFEVEESDSSDDDVFINDAFLEDDFGPDIDVKAEPKTPNIPFFPKEEDMDEEELDRIMEERYKPGSNFVKYAEDRPHTESSMSNERSTHMSHVEDPTIWKVKCMVGRERHSAFCLMQKYVDLKAIGTKLEIVSAFAVEHVKGFIYIEAKKQSDINEACSGLCNIYPSRVSAVPVSDVPHLFSVRSKVSGVKVDTWARVKAGKYKGDLAQVVSVNEVQRKVTVKLVPRIDLQAVAEKFGGGVKGKKLTIPAPRLITSSELEAYRPLIQYRHDRQTGDTYEVFDGMTLKDGYLFKKVPLDSLSFWDVRPSEAELIKFMLANQEESNDVEWLTGLFGERTKKKKQTVNNGKTGEKGEGSSSMEDIFEVPDLVFHGRKAFGIVIGREKDDRIKVLEEGTEDKQLVVAVESRLLKKADFDKKFNALDKNKKIIHMNDIVRVLEGPLEDKRGIVKQIYKGVVFVHDENLQENCGYFCAKAQICEKIQSSSAHFSKGGKGGKSGGSDFEEFPTSPKSPLSPKKPFEGLDSNRNFEDKEGFSVGQSVRIRVGPLKGYMCRVMAIRYSDITVKLDSQHKILTVKAEHLAEVKGKSAAVTTGDGGDAAKPFDLLGESSQGWMDGEVAAESGSGGWNTGGQTTERSSWAPAGSTDNDASKDGEGSGWGAKPTKDEGTAWGEKKESGSGGWGSSGTKTETETGGWGSAAASEKKPAWGAPAPATETGGWGGGSNDNEGKSAETGGWGAKKDEGTTAGWGKSADTEASGGSAWGKKAADDGGAAGGGWGKSVTADKEADGGSGWGSKKDEGGSGWGSKKDEGGSSWGKTAGAGGSSWGNQDGGGGSSWSKQDSGGGGSQGGRGSGGCFKCGESGHMSRECPKGGGGGGSTCYKCGESGHMSRECPKGGGGGGNACFKCGESGHMSRECPQGGGSRNCYKCGESGHMSRECPQGGGGGGGGNCYKCGESGHMSRECPQGGGGGGGRNCYKCGKSGHMSRECPQGGGGGGGGSCYKCGESGHMSRECPQGGGGPKTCFKCGESGHMSRECPQGGSGGGGGGGRNCYKCGESGHMSRECPQGGGGGRSCYKCGESGHMSRECPQGGGGGGGGGGGSWGGSSGGWGSDKAADAGAGGWSSGNGTGGGWGSKQATDATDSTQGGGGWASSGGSKAPDAQGSGGNQTGGWGSSGGGGWGNKDDAQGSGTQTGGGWGSNKKDDDAGGSGWNKSGGW